MKNKRRKLFIPMLIFLLIVFPLFSKELGKKLLKHIRFFSSDKTLGRAPGDSGILIAQNYLKNQFITNGLSPAFESSFFQKFKITAQKPLSVLLKLITKEGKIKLKFKEDFVLNSGVISENVFGKGNAVFLGFGIKAPEFLWNDYKGVNLKGKVIIVFVNDPGFLRSDLFFGKKLSYYGRWTYKFEEAERMGADGVLLVHNSQMAGYGWNVVKNSWGKEEMFLEKYKNLKIKGWISEETFKRILKLSKINYDKLLKASSKKDFKPINLPLSIEWRVKNKIRTIDVQNTGGCFYGKDKKAIVLTAHIDHLGYRKDLSGDNIFNGALDNSSGVSSLIVLSEMLKKYQNNHTICFVATTLEEYGLLGAEYYSRNLKRESFLLNVNIDMLNPFGETEDVRFIGKEFIDFGKFKKFLNSLGLKVYGDPMPEIGMLYRMDHLPFLGRKLPSISLAPGLISKSGSNLKNKWIWFFKNIYHTPKDEISDFWKEKGLVQQVETLHKLIVFIDKNIKNVKFLDKKALILKPVFLKYGK